MSDSETRKRRTAAEPDAEPKAGPEADSAPELPESSESPEPLAPIDQADADYQHLIAQERMKRSATRRITDVIDSISNYLQQTSTEEWKSVATITTSREAAAQLATKLFQALEAGL